VKAYGLITEKNLSNEKNAFSPAIPLFMAVIFNRGSADFGSAKPKGSVSIC